jgi:hypothetical protein
VLLEPSGELGGVVEDLLGASRHGDHLRYFGRAGMACTVIGPSVLSMTPTSSSAPTAKQHRRLLPR